MHDAVAVRAEALEITQSNWRFPVHFGNRHRVMDLDTSISERSQFGGWNQSASLAKQVPVLLDEPALLQSRSTGLSLPPPMLPKLRMAFGPCVFVVDLWISERRSVFFGEDVVSGVLNDVEAGLPPPSGEIRWPRGAANDLLQRNTKSRLRWQPHPGWRKDVVVLRYAKFVRRAGFESLNSLVDHLRRYAAKDFRREPRLPARGGSRVKQSLQLNCGLTRHANQDSLGRVAAVGSFGLPFGQTASTYQRDKVIKGAIEIRSFDKLPISHGPMLHHPAVQPDA